RSVVVRSHRTVAPATAALSLHVALPILLSAFSAKAPSSVSVIASGELASEDVSVLQLAALRGVFSSVVVDQVTFVNAPRLAEELGVQVSVSTQPESTNYRSQVTVRTVHADGSSYSVSGAVTGKDDVHKLIEVNGRHFDIRAEGHMLLLEYPDRPGIMGRGGTLLGAAGINIEA